jgi:hypothetical protein
MPCGGVLSRMSWNTFVKKEKLVLFTMKARLNIPRKTLPF